MKTLRVFAATMTMVLVVTQTYGMANQPAKPWIETLGCDEYGVSAVIHFDIDGDGYYDNEAWIMCDGGDVVFRESCVVIGIIPAPDWHLGTPECTLTTADIYAWSIPVLAPNDAELCRISFDGTGAPYTSCGGSLR